MNQILSRIRALPVDARWLVVALVGLVGIAAFVLTRDLGPSAPKPTEPAGFALTPDGGDVPRLSPIRVTFASAPSERDGAKLLKVEPQPKGEYAWLSDRTLLFQPDYPGMLRGETYTVTVRARPETGLVQDVQKQFTTSGLLTVVQAIPSDGDTEVPSNAQIMVQFSRSVAPLTVLAAQRTTPVITFDPPLNGTGEWLNTSLYRFTPALAPNTTYHLKIAAGLTSEADGVLKQDYAWSFTTIGPAVASVTPDANTKFGAPRQPVVVTFNQGMDKAAVESAFRLLDANGSPVAGTMSWANDFSTATYTPSANLKPAGVYTIVVPKGLKGANGGETKEERRSSFTVAGLPTVANTSPMAGETSAGRFGLNITFLNPMNPDSLDGKISVSGFSAEDVANGLNVFDEQHAYVSLSLKPSTSYTASIAAGATDRYGQVMGAYRWSFTTGALPSSISLATPGYSAVGTYAASAEPVLYYHATNVSSASFTLWPLTKDEMRSLNGPKYGGPPPPTFKPSQPALRTWTEPVSGAKDEVLILSTSLSGGGPLPKGDYFVQTSGDRFSSMFFEVVDTEIILKLSNDELAGWVIDHDTGRPVAGAAVQADGSGLSASTATTDANGLFTLAVPRPDIGKNLSRNYLVTLDSGGRRGIASTAWQQGSYPYQLNIPLEYYTRTYVANVYSDRPIYRPGETVQFKGVVRADDDAHYSIPAAQAPLEVRIRSNDGKELYKTDVTLNDFGTFGGSFQLPGDAATGDYLLMLSEKPVTPAGATSPPAFGVSVASVGFLVAEFRKPEFEVNVTTGSPAYVNGDKIDTTVKASFFFGGGLQGAPVEWSVLSSPYTMRADGYERYSFADFDYARTSIVRKPTRATGKAITAADGTVTFSVPAVLQGDEGAQQFQLSATVTDQSAQAVANSTTVVVHPGSYYVGIHPDQYVATTGKETTISLVSVGIDGKPVANKAVSVKVYDRKWVTTKVQTPDGARQYKSEPKDTLLDTLSATTNAKGEATVRLTPKTAGTIRLIAEIADEKGRTTRSAAYLWVAGSEFASWQITNDDTIKLVADRDSYEVGDTAQVMVPAPFAGAKGLVTVERGKIISRELRDFPTNSERLSIPITDGSVPDIFVTVVLYRPPTAEDPIPRYKIGYVELPVSTKTRSLNVSIQPDRQQAKPGDTVRYAIKVTDANGKGVKSEVSVAVIDKALLSLQADRSSTGLKAFWFERGLGVQTSSSLAVSVNRSNDVIAQAPAGGKGGGGLDDDRLRQDFQNTAYWTAQLVTGADGAATVDVKMPDNLTTWHMDVRAVSGDTLVGEGQNELVSTQPLLLRPALPRFLRVGDSVTLRLLVGNASLKSSDVSVSLAAEGVDVTGDSSHSAKIDAGKTVVMEWPAKVTAEGTAKLTFTASGSGGLKDAVVQTLPVKLDVTPETAATGGIVIGEALSEALYLPSFAILRGGSLQVSVQPSLTGSAANEVLPMLDPLPFEWSERIASRLMAAVGVRRAEKSAGRLTAAYDSRIATDTASLIGQQRPDGGWSWCDKCPGSDPNVTGWALIALGEAKRDGQAVSGQTSYAATGYVNAQVNRVADVAHPADPSQKAFLIYALAVGGAPDTANTLARSLFEQYRSKLTSWGRAYLILALNENGATKDDPVVQQLLNDLAASTLPSANGNHWEDDRVTGAVVTNTTATALVLEALTRVAPDHPLISETARWLVVARGQGHWATTIEKSEAILALSDYAVKTGELAGEFGYQVQIDGADILSGRFAPSTEMQTTSKQVPLTDFRAGSTSILTFLRDFTKPGRLYYSLNLRYLTPAKEVEAVSRGFGVSHQYTLLDGPTKPITSAKLGDTVRVTVTVVSPTDHNYAVIDDLLPAGLEPVDTRLQTVDPKLLAQLQADRAAAAGQKLGDYYAPWLRWYYSPFQHVDTRDDRVTLSAYTLPKGVYQYVYYARAAVPGDFFVAPVHAEETYFPEVFGRSDSGRFVVRP